MNNINFQKDARHGQDCKPVADFIENKPQISRQVDFPGAEFFNDIMLGDDGPSYALTAGRTVNQK